MISILIKWQDYYNIRPWIWDSLIYSQARKVALKPRAFQTIRMNGWRPAVAQRLDCARLIAALGTTSRIQH